MYSLGLTVLISTSLSYWPFYSHSVPFFGGDHAALLLEIDDINKITFYVMDIVLI